MTTLGYRVGAGHGRRAPGRQRLEQLPAANGRETSAWLAGLFDSVAAEAGTGVRGDRTALLLERIAT